MENEGIEVGMRGVQTYTPAYISDNDNNIKFKIPLYQRLFAWKKKAIEGLLSDLQEHFYNPKTCSEPYYLGIITEIYDSKEHYFVVIDGQQRITVLMLLAAYFSQKNEYWRGFLFAGDGYERNRPAQSGDDAAPGHDKECLARLYLFARPEDKDCFLRLIYQPKKSLENKEKTLMEEGYETIEKFLSTHFSGESEKEIFSRNIFDRLTLLVTNLESSYLKNPDYLNRYFEIMNSNYKNLEQHDVLKVQLATGAPNARELFSLWEICENFSEDVIEILEKKQKEWQQKNSNGNRRENIKFPSIHTSSSLRDYVESIANELKKPALPPGSATGNTNDSASRPSSGDASQKKQKIADIEKAYASSTSAVTTGGRSIINFPQFLLLALDIFLDVKIRQPVPTQQRRKHYESAQLLETFANGRKLFTPGQSERFFIFLLELRVLLDFYVLRREDADESSYSLLLGKLKDEDKKKDSLWGPERAHCRLAQYQAMLDAAFPESFYTWLKPYLLELYKFHFGDKENKDFENRANNHDCLPAEPEAAAEMLLTKLKNEDDLRVMEGKILSQVVAPAKLRYNAQIDRYWFWRLDYYLWEGCGKSTKELLGKNHLRAARAYRIRTNRSIEHLYPQQPESPLAQEDAPDTDSFGNLAMISPSLNSRLRNYEVSFKFMSVGKQVAEKKLQSLKLLAMYQAVGEKGENWKKTTAEEHERRMIDILLASFSRNPLQKITQQASAGLGG